MTIETSRLELVPATIESLQAAIAGREALGKALRARVPQTWPYEYLDDAAFQFTIDRLRASPDLGGHGDHGDHGEWWMYFIIKREVAASAPSVDGRGERTLIGGGGYKGPPTADGTVEIGYGIVEDERRRGFAVEACIGLIERAFADPRVSRVVIETLPELVASIAVARSLGFREAGAGSEAGVIRFVMGRRE